MGYVRDRFWEMRTANFFRSFGNNKVAWATAASLKMIFKWWGIKFMVDIYLYPEMGILGWSQSLLQTERSVGDAEKPMYKWWAGRAESI